MRIVSKSSSAALLSFFLALFVFVETASAEYPRAYFGLPEVYDVSLSPDGTHTAILTNEAIQGWNPSEVWSRLDIHSNEAGEVVRTDRTEEKYYNWVRWVFDDVILAQTAIWSVPNKSRKRLGYEVAIKAINPETGEQTNIWEGPWESGKDGLNLPEFIDFSRDRREFVIELDDGKSTNLYAINVDTGAQRLIAKGNKRTQAWELDENLVPKLRLDKGKRDNQELIYRRMEDGEWKLISLYNPLENDFRPVSRVDDQNTMLVVFRPGDARQAGLYRYNLENNSYSEPLFEHEGRDLSSIGYRSFSGELLYTGWYDGNLKKHWLDKDVETIGKQIDKALRPDDNWRVVETNLENTKWLLYISSPRRPGRYFYMNLETKRIKPVIRSRPNVKDEHVFPIEIVKYQAADGLDLIGYFIAGRGTSASPLIVLPHGGPVARDYPDYDGLAQFLAYRGYNVFQPQFRGSGGFGVEFEIAGFGEWGRKMQTDIEDGVQALITQNLIEPTARRAIVGGSYGGYAAMAAATLTPDNYQCVISFNGVSDLPAMLASYDQNEVLDKFVYDIWAMRIGDPETELDRILKVSPYQHLDRVKAPIYLIHGTKDDIVDISQSKRTFERLRELKKASYFHALEGADHTLSDEDHRDELLVMMDRFLRTCMPAR